MASQYNHSAIEKKWRENWEKNPINVNDGKKEKYYCLDMFPYPSGNGLHVGHWRLILLAKDLTNDDHRYFATLPVSVRRNAYGRQLGSFTQQKNLKALEKCL